MIKEFVMHFPTFMIGKKINRELMYNEYVPIHSQYSNSPYENPNNEKFNYNPQKAIRAS